MAMAQRWLTRRVPARPRHLGGYAWGTPQAHAASTPQRLRQRGIGGRGARGGRHAAGQITATHAGRARTLVRMAMLWALPTGTAPLPTPHPYTHSLWPAAPASPVISVSLSTSLATSLPSRSALSDSSLRSARQASERAIRRAAWREGKRKAPRRRAAAQVRAAFGTQCGTPRTFTRTAPGKARQLEAGTPGGGTPQAEGGAATRNEDARAAAPMWRRRLTWRPCPGCPAPPRS